MSINTYRKRKEELERLMASPNAMSDQVEFTKMSREYKRVQTIVELADRVDQVRAAKSDSEEMLQDESAEVRALAEEELATINETLPALEEELDLLLVPPDPEDLNDAMVEVRAGTGGDEAALFAQELLRMYTRFAEEKEWKSNIVSSSYTELGGIKEAIIEIQGEGAYGELKWESGVHRVQRVPETEKAGRSL